VSSIHRAYRRIGEWFVQVLNESLRFRVSRELLRGCGIFFA